MDEIDDRCRLLSSILGVLVRSIASWVKGKIRPLRRIQTPKKRKKPYSTHKPKFTNESQSRTEADDRSINCCVHACVHVHYAYAQLQLQCMLFQSIALNWARVTTVSRCSTTKKMAEQRQENNKPTKGTIEIWGRRSLPGKMRQTTRSRAYLFRKDIFAPAPRR